MSASQRAAIEKNLAYYIQLPCGHFIPREVSKLYRVFKTTGISADIYCETCDRWQSPVYHETKRAYPDIPLF